MSDRPLQELLASIPRDWFVGPYEMQLDTLTAGRVNTDFKLIEGATGTAWLRLPCAVPPLRPLPYKIIDVLGDAVHGRSLFHAVEVVSEVRHPQTEISVADAKQLGHTAKVGETIAIPLDNGRFDLQSIIELERGIGDWLATRPHAGEFAVEFHDITVSLAEASFGRARIIDGSVTYPIAGVARPSPIKIVVAGFTLILTSLDLGAWQC